MLHLPSSAQVTTGVLLFGSLELLYPRLYKNEKSGLLLLFLLSAFARIAMTNDLQLSDSIPLFIASGFSLIKFLITAGKFFFTFPRTMTPIKFVFCLIAFIFLTPFYFYYQFYRGIFFWFFNSVVAALFYLFSGLDIPYEQVSGFSVFFLIPFATIWIVLNIDHDTISDYIVAQQSPGSRWTPPRDRALFADLIYRYDRFRNRI